MSQFNRMQQLAGLNPTSPLNRNLIIEGYYDKEPYRTQGEKDLRAAFDRNKRELEQQRAEERAEKERWEKELRDRQEKSPKYSSYKEEPSPSPKIKNPRKSYEPPTEPSYEPPAGSFHSKLISSIDKLIDFLDKPRFSMGKKYRPYVEKEKQAREK